MATYKQEMARALRRWRAKGFAEQAEFAAQGIINSTEDTWYSDSTWTETRNNNGDRGTIDAGAVKVATWGLWYITDGGLSGLPNDAFKAWCRRVEMSAYNPRKVNGNTPMDRKTVVLCACVAYDNDAYEQMGYLMGRDLARNNEFNGVYVHNVFVSVKDLNDYDNNRLPYISVGYWRRWGFDLCGMELDDNFYLPYMRGAECVKGFTVPGV